MGFSCAKTRSARYRFAQPRHADVINIPSQKIDEHGPLTALTECSYATFSKIFDH
jgi:hypothetical protein